jgi:four helix bundle protein
VRNEECGVWNGELRQSDEGKERIVMVEKDLQQRTKQFSLSIIKLVDALPRGRTAEVIGRQLLRCGTSVGANYRAACRARSNADFISKMCIVEEEADESLYWMELFVEAEIVKLVELESLMKEADEILAMTVASIKTARERKSRT